MATPSNEFRQDPLSGDWILISPGRGKKPGAREAVSFPDHECPFDDPQATHQEAPVAIYSHGQKVDTVEGWTLQVLPNKSPAVSAGQCGPVIDQGLYSVAAGVGAHELVVTRDHDRYFSDLTVEEMAEVIRAYRDRYQVLSAELCNKCVTIFHNHGVLAGASVKHNHSQIISMPVVPPELSRMFARCADHLTRTGRRLIADLVAEESTHRTRVVAENENFVAVCPFASRSPYEVNIFPKFSQSSFADLSEDALPMLAALMREVFIRIDKAVSQPDYLFFIHSAASHDASAIAFDWHIEIMPRFSPTAGLEFGAGVFVNTVDPDEAAQALTSISL
jgi:UDPglucose--hexose-1-phosphate uridylyltransferase